MINKDTELRVLIADHEPEVRQALHLVCEESLGQILVIEAANSEELLHLMETSPLDILLLEWELPGIPVDALMKQLKNLMDVSVIAISNRPETRAEALEAGASAFVYKGDPPNELISLLQARGNQ